MPKPIADLYLVGEIGEGFYGGGTAHRVVTGPWIVQANDPAAAVIDFLKHSQAIGGEEIIAVKLPAGLSFTIGKRKKGG